MPNPRLESLTDGEYDEYFYKHMNDLQQQAESFQSLLAQQHYSTRQQQQHEQPYHYYPHRHNYQQHEEQKNRASTQVYLCNDPSCQYYPSQTTRYPSQRPPATDSWKIATRRRRDPVPPFVLNKDGPLEDKEQDEDDESMDEMEVLAAQNAERNVLGLYDDQAPPPEGSTKTASTSQPPSEQPSYTATPEHMTAAAEAPAPRPANERQPPQTQTSSSAVSSSGMPPKGLPKEDGKKRRRWLFSRLFQKSSTAPKATYTQTPPNLSPSQSTNSTASIGRLDRVFVFRHPQQSEDNVWVSFDYANQERLSLYNSQVGRMPYGDQGCELFDSHIQQGQLPILVLPSRNQAFYPTDWTGDTIVQLEVACFPNSSDLRFVCRQ
ncbi:hypothetical protein BCR43DRAFT_489403 [Syncephalastrum racemosum]|uniref:Uncharacterized protein n=1 Tax=Syncephalastrum racemosum TaxID=13706 RepID=A0A1X2HE54_SYNRA|nr:hypothetical protein BCR43DRAFT_489403 [Syncephalastrum racemosum]